MTHRDRTLAFAATARRIGRMLPVVLLALVLVACDSVEERAEKHYQNGLELIENGETAKASLEFRNAIRLDEGHIGAHLALGNIYQEASNFAAAVFQYRKVIEADASVLEAHLKLGQMMLAFNEVDEALKASVAASQLAPDDPAVLVLESAVALRAGETAKAREIAERALEIDGGFSDGWVMQAAISRVEKNLETSLEQVDEALRRDPANNKAALFRLNLLSEMGRNDAVGEALADLVAQNPRTLAFWEARARWQLGNERFEEAEESLRRMWEIAPNDIDRSLDIVRLVGRTRGREAAIEELQRLVEVATRDEVKATLEIAIAEFEMQQGKGDEAAARLQEVIESTEQASDEGTLARVRLARLRLAEGQTDASKALLDEALSFDATDARALTMRGRIKLIEEDYDGAIRDLRAAEAEAPDELEIVELLAVAHQRNGSADLAGERLSKAVQLTDYGVEQVLRHAEFLAQQDRAEVAAEQVRDALRRRPEDVRLLNALARLLIATQDYSGAEEIAERMRANPATASVGDQIMAAALSGQERFDETIELLESVYAGEERNDAYLGALVATHLRNDDIEAAMRLLDNALADNPGNADAMRIKGTVEMIAGNDEAARVLIEKAVETAPQIDVNHLALYRYHASSGDIETATETLRTGIETTDSNVLRLNLAMLLETQGHIEESIEQYRVLYERQPGSAIVANNLASLITDSNPTEAEIQRAYTIARRLRESDVPHFQDTYGWLQYLRGDLAGARATLERAASALPDNPIAQYHLGVVLAELGVTERAKERLEAAIALAGERSIPQIAPARDVLARLEAASATEGGAAAGGTD